MIPTVLMFAETCDLQSHMIQEKFWFVESYGSQRFLIPRTCGLQRLPESSAITRVHFPIKLAFSWAKKTTARNNLTHRYYFTDSCILTSYFTINVFSYYNLSLHNCYDYDKIIYPQIILKTQWKSTVREIKLNMI